MYDERLVETLCRKIKDEKDCARATQLMSLLQDVVKEDHEEICRHLSRVIEKQSEVTYFDPSDKN